MLRTINLGDSLTTAAVALTAYPVSDLEDVYVTIDSTGMGGAMFMQALSDVIPGVTGFDFAGQPGKKGQLISDLATAIDKGWLKLPALLVRC